MRGYKNSTVISNRIQLRAHQRLTEDLIKFVKLQFSVKIRKEID